MEILRQGEKQSYENFIEKEKHLIKDARFTLIEMLQGERNVDRSSEKARCCTKVV